VLQCGAVYCSVLQCVEVCCSVLQCVAVCCSMLTHPYTELVEDIRYRCCSVLQRVAACCSVLQCVAVCCDVLRRVAMCCSVLQCADTPMHRIGRGHTLSSVFEHASFRSAGPRRGSKMAKRRRFLFFIDERKRHVATRCNTLQHPAT